MYPSVWIGCGQICFERRNKEYGRKERRKEERKARYRKKKKRLEETDRTVKWLSLNDGVG